VNPKAIKHEVPEEDGGKRTHPAYFPLQEQWERYIQEIQYLQTGQAFVRLPNDQVKKTRIRSLPALTVSERELAAVKEEYLRRYFEEAKNTGAASDAAGTVDWGSRAAAVSARAGDTQEMQTPRIARRGRRGARRRSSVLFSAKRPSEA
jgi:hypothetical protein